MEFQMNQWSANKTFSLLAALAGISACIVSGAGRSYFSSSVWAQDSKKPADRKSIVLDRSPIRKLEDPNATLHAIAVDVERGEVFVGNDNIMSPPSIMAYPLDFAPTDKVMEPKRRIAGPKTNLGAICGLAISPEAKELYAVDGDGESMDVFSLEANGDVPPARQLAVAHGSGGVYLDLKHDELFITTEHVNKITVFRRTAQGEEKPLRTIQGSRTKLADSHGIYVDTDKDEIFVVNHGHWRETAPGEDDARRKGGDGSRRHPGVPEDLAPSTGQFFPPSITVYSRTAQGDVAPLRVIEGPRTRLNVPSGILLDPASNQLIVANAGDDSLLFFDRDAVGNAAPVRVLQGPLTNIKGPTGISVDLKRNELWVTNWDNHTATVFPRNAKGNVAPLRLIRTAPKDVPAPGFATAGGLAYDPKRDEILINN